MELHELLTKIHRTIETKENKDITRGDMAFKIGVKPRTYTEYLRGKTNQPLAMKALLNLLSELDDEEVIKIVRMWNK
jgi:transcriptional regulator with XRE-family HTH domain